MFKEVTFTFFVATIEAEYHGTDPGKLSNHQVQKSYDMRRKKLNNFNSFGTESINKFHFSIFHRITFK